MLCSSRSSSSRFSPELFTARLLDEGSRVREAKSAWISWHEIRFLESAVSG